MDYKTLKLVPIKQKRGLASQLRQTPSTMGRVWRVSSPETAGGVIAGME
ncbi:MAG: hypothetical protein ACLQJ7_09295 [Syntrophobacteraceae bacterium]